jgi:hypothetical protein
MNYYKYQLDDELRVVEDSTGSRELGVYRKVKAPSESLREHVKAVKDFRDGMEVLLTEFVEEIDGQEREITSQIQHGEFFLEEFRKNQWNANPMFDRVRLMYTSSIDSLKKEARQLRREKIKHRMAFMKELLDAKKELSPFTKLF